MTKTTSRPSEIVEPPSLGRGRGEGERDLAQRPQAAGEGERDPASAVHPSSARSTTSPASALRPDLAQIAGWIAPDTQVLDLGCGDGALLAHLRHQKNCRGYGVEISDDHVAECVRAGVNVIQSNLDAGLAMFGDRMFDTVVLSQTLQAVHNAEAILKEMMRVARQGIVSFPNFGYWKHPLSLLAGRMPVTPDIPFQWYDTPNIHLCTLKDFEDLAATVGLVITGRVVLAGGRRVSVAPSLRATLAVYRFEVGRLRAGE